VSLDHFSRAAARIALIQRVAFCDEQLSMPIDSINGKRAFR